MAAKIFRINYKSDFILTLESDAGWMTPFCIKFWTGAPSQAFFAGWDGTTYTHCSYDPSEPTKLVVQFDDHHLPIGDLKLQIAYHFTVADFPNDTEDEVINPADITTLIDGQEYQVMLDFTGETAPEIQFSLPAYANEAQRIENEQQRIANEQERIDNEQTRQRNEGTRIENEQERVQEFGQMKGALEQATRDAAAAAENANEKGVYAKNQGDYAKQQGDYAKQQGDLAQADHERAEEDHRIAGEDHTQAGSDHTRAGEDHTQAGSDHTRAGEDHTRAGDDHTRANQDHTRAESDHAAVEVYVDSLGAYDISAAHAVGGVLATYANLQAALGTNGANIPEAIRKGGMSVKFVQSSDNNYVQFRCMSDEFTTDVTKWQGVDAEPTRGSHNLVESGGVEAVLTSESDRAKTEEQKLDVDIKELPVVDEENGVLFLSDDQGNVIGKFYKKGLKTTSIEIVERIVSKLFQGEANNSLYVSDEYGNVIAKVDKTGITSYKVIGRYFQNSDFRTSFVVSDDFGNVILKADQNGVDYNGIVRQSDIPSPSAYMTVESDSNFPCDINMAITHGQSNSMNGNNNIAAQLDFKNSVTFANGKLSLAGGDYDNKTAEELDVLFGGGFSPMSEYTGNLFSLGGFIAGYISDIMNENKISDYNSFGNQFIGATTGQVASIVSLTNPNDVYYARIINAVTFAKKYADEQGKSFCVNALTYIEGEWDYTMDKKRFYDYLWVFFSNIAHDIMQITGQSFVPCFMTYQYASAYYMSRNSANHIISDGSNQALVQMAIDTGDGTGYTLDNEPAAYLKSGVTLIDRSNVHLSCPFYMLDSQEKNTLETMHLNWSEGCYNIFGAYQGLQAKRSITDGHSIGVLRPKSHTIKQMSNGKYVTTIEFDVPVPPLQIKAYDSNFGNMVTGVSYEPNYGFNLSQVSHSWDYENIIESVQAKRMKYVEIITTSNPTGLYLSYAQKGWLGGGNLCDSQGNMCKFTTSGKTFDLDNWCPQFEYQLV